VLFETLAIPALWSTFANDQAYHLLVLIFQAAQALNIPSGGNYLIPSGPVQGGNEPGINPQTPLSHAFQAIVGADDFVDIDNHVVMKDVLNEIVDVTQNVSPTRE
jgi:hypothetical protein